MKGLSKSAYMAGKECDRRAWLDANQPQLRAAPSESARARMKVGEEVGELARQLFPGGLSAWSPGMSNKEAIEATQTLLSLPETPAVFEASFEAGGLWARADILLRSMDDWEIMEVKSSATPKADHEEDVLFQYLAASEAGVFVPRAWIVLLNSQFRLDDNGLDPERLFVRHPVELSQRKLAKIHAESRRQLEVAAQPEEPPRVRTKACGDCPYQGHCYGRLAPQDIVFMPYAKPPRLAAWEARGITDVRDIPEDEDLNPSQIHYRLKMSLLRPEYGPRLAPALSDIALPAAFIDFEADTPALPWARGCRPYEQIPFQFSCHIVEDWAKPPRRIGFLWPRDGAGSSDPRPPFVKALLDLVGSAATVIHYAPYELQCLKALVKAEIPLAQEALDAFSEKALDLEDLVSQNVRHPGFYAKTSIKVVLPALCPEYSDRYTSLEIANGEAAVIAFSQARKLAAGHPEQARLLDALDEYCALDSLAMVEIVKALRREAGLD